MATSQLRLHNLNDVKLVGRITRDPELRYTGKGQAVCRIDLAVNRRYKDATGEWKEDTTFVPVVVWREAAQRCSERLKKGSPVFVEGRLKSRNWETKEGQKRTSLEVETRSIQFLEKLTTSEEGEGVAVATEESANAPEGSNSPASVSAEEEIPF